MTHTDDPGGVAPARGADTIIAVTERARRAGFGGSTRVEADGVVVCLSCSSKFGAADYHVVHEHRLEGASDVADMMLLVAGRCPVCDESSTLVLGYGPNAGREDAAVLEQLDLDDASPVPTEPPPTPPERT